MQATRKAAYTRPTLQRVSLLSNALTSLALACCRATREPSLGAPTPVIGQR
jgi:hypothetical protein